ncbi:hypothetical protein [Streptomyces sp. cg35]|uniref:hypothetical protein n=1 Tax=Streptomyces sp. cg35 TaxID=3421650 RepID=UPI003D170084
MRLAAALVLTCVLFGAAPATAQAAPTAGSVSYTAQSSQRAANSLGTGIGKSTGGSSGSKTSRGGGYSSHYGRQNSSTGTTGKQKMPLWQAILFLLGLGGAVIWGLVRLVRKIRRAVTS